MGDNINLPEGYKLVGNGRMWQLTKDEWIPAESRRRPRILMRDKWNAMLFYKPISAALYADRHARAGLKANQAVAGTIHASANSRLN